MAKKKKLVLKATRRLVMSGVVFMNNDVVQEDIVEYDTMVMALAKGWVLPVGGWQELPEPMFTDVMEKRD